MTRTKIRDRILPSYTAGEEIFNMVTHIVGGGLGIAILVVCLGFSVTYGDMWKIVSSAIYGVSMVLLYCVSSIYHGLRPSTGKKVMQVIDHCTIYFLIGGTYTPIALCALRPSYPAFGWTIFGIVWGFAVLATVLTAIDLKKYSVFSMLCYIGMGWCIVIALKLTVKVLTMRGFLWLLAGGLCYTVGAVLYGMGKKHRYVHSVFHIFVVAGSVLQFICILFFVIL